MSNQPVHILHLHAVALFQLALVSDGISKSQVANRLKHMVVVNSCCVCVSGALVSYMATILPLWEGPYVFIYSHDTHR